MIGHEEQARERKTAEAKKRGFDEFMAAPMTRMAISMIPRNDQHPEVLESLLQAAFDIGFNRGMGEGVVDFAQAMLSKDFRTLGQRGR